MRNDISKTQTFLVIGLMTYFGCQSLSAARFSWNRYDNKPDEWFRSDGGRQIAENILTFQDKHGSWPKNIDTAAKAYSGDPDDLRGTFDNRATTGEMRFLAKAYNVTQDDRYKAALIKGLDLILKAQYPTGGWPQYYPPGKGYPRYITFNDGAMVSVMELLKDVVSSNDFAFVDTGRRTAAQAAFDRGIECILKCQIKVDGKLKVWCAQHDETDYSPRPARSYELVSLSGGESAGILRLLMSLDEPTPEIIKAITAGVNWYKEAKIEGVHAQWINGEFSAIKDTDATPVWGRFCEIKTDRAFFCNRDGIPRYTLDEIDHERRTGYKWYGDWGEDVFRDYQKWSQQHEHLLLSEETKILAIIGDSTVCDYPKDQVRRGWGQFIQGYFTDSIKVINKARSGRSTKTFIQEGLWEKVLELKPDYVLIQFGHNDSHAPEKPESTDAAKDYRDYLRKYIYESRQVGAIPVLVTPMYRRKFDDTGKIKDNLLPYADAMKVVASEQDASIIDLNSASEKLYIELGPEGVVELANALDDQTHFNKKGAQQMANLVMQQLPTVEASLQKYLKDLD